MTRAGSDNVDCLVSGAYAIIEAELSVKVTILAVGRLCIDAYAGCGVGFTGDLEIGGCGNLTVLGKGITSVGLAT